MDATLTAEQRGTLHAASDLKGQLVDFALTPPFQRPWRRKLRELDSTQHDPESGAIMATESLLFEFSYDDGSTVLDRFLIRHPGLTAAQRDLVDSWADTVFGIFEVTQRHHDVLHLHNLLDELPYLAFASQGAASVEPVDEGSFVITRLLPVEDVWLVSGIQVCLPSDLRAHVAGVVRNEALRHPELVLRNPEKLTRARELTRSLHASFLDCFDADRVVVPGPDAAATYQRFLAHHHARTATRSTAAPAPAHTAWDEHLADHQTVALWHRRDTGVWFLTEFQTVYDAFSDPALASEPAHRDVVLGYLTDDSIPPFVIQQLCAEFPHAADQVLRTVLHNPGFGWERDGEALMRMHKATHYRDTAPLPASIELPSICKTLGPTSSDTL